MPQAEWLSRHGAQPRALSRSVAARPNITCWPGGPWKHLASVGRQLRSQGHGGPLGFGPDQTQRSDACASKRCSARDGQNPADALTMPYVTPHRAEGYFRVGQYPSAGGLAAGRDGTAEGHREHATTRPNRKTCVSACACASTRSVVFVSVRAGRNVAACGWRARSPPGHGFGGVGLGPCCFDGRRRPIRSCKGLADV